VNHPGPFNQKTELLAYELWQGHGRPWGTREAMGGVEDARHAAGPRGPRHQVSRRRDSPIRLDGKYFCRLPVSGVTPQPPAARARTGTPWSSTGLY
jgi:hypothetical protein